MGVRETVKMIKERQENGKSGEGKQQSCDKGGNKRIRVVMEIVKMWFRKERRIERLR